MIDAKAAVRSPLTIGLFASAVFLTNLISRYPGFMNWDANKQYAEAVSRHFSDWQPPVMAWLWSLLRLVVDGSGMIFTLHQTLYWLGFGLIAVTFSRLGRPGVAWGILAVALLPPFLMLNIEIIKDVGLAASLLSGFAIIFWYRARSAKPNIIALFASIMLLVYGTLLRANAVFASPPLFIYALCPSLLSRPRRFFSAYLFLTIALIPASDLFNHQILGAHASHPLRSLQIFDVAGIAHFSGDITVFGGGGGAVTKELLSACYTPLLWDPLGDEGCPFFAEGLGPEPTKTWLSAIVLHPTAYAEHRLTHFYFEMNAHPQHHHAVDAKYNWMIYSDEPPVTFREKVTDDMDALFRPWLALGLGLILFYLCFPKATAESSPLQGATAVLTTSGLFYTIAYLGIGVASVFRYQYWAVIAILIASVISASAQCSLRVAAIFPFVARITPQKSGRQSE
jgi:hypothetical protein